MRIDRRQALLGGLVAALVGRRGALAAAAAFGPAPGTRAPELGVLRDQYGVRRRLDALAGEKGVVLMFFRSAAWCPFCQAQLIAMNEGAAEMARRGYRVVGLSYDGPAVNKAFTERRKIAFPLLSDPGSKVIDRWGLRDPQYPVGNLAYGVPRPIIFVIDRKGVIRAALAEETYRTRPPVAEVLKMLDSLSGPSS